MTISRRQQLLVLAALAAVALLAADRLLFSPLARIWKERATRLAELKKSVAQGTLLLQRQKAIRARWEQMRANTLAPELSVAENQLLQAFDRWSQESRVGISSVKPQRRRNADDYATIECRVDAFGSLPALTRLLYELEKDPLGLKVEVAELTARDNRGQQLTLALQVSGLILNPTATP